MSKKNAGKSKGTAQRRGKKQEPGWFGPTVLGVAVVFVALLMAMKMCTGPSEEEEAAAEAAKPAPTLVGYAEPDESFPKRRLRYASADEAEQLFGEGCEWFLRWQHAEPPARIELLVFRKRSAADSAWEREPGEEILGESGEFEKKVPSAPRIALRRGKLLARIRGGEGVSADALEPLVREFDAALVRTWGAHPE